MTRIPTLGGKRFLTDGGIETVLIFQEGVELPLNAAFVLLRDAAGADRLRAYYERYIAIARARGAGFVLESPTWRANPDWAARLGIGAAELDELNRAAIELMRELAETHASASSQMVVSGCVGPRGDGYRPEALMSADEAAAYHAAQVAAFAAAGADMVAAITMTHVGEATGVARAAQAAGLPVAISFTVETDARLPSGDTLADAIAAVDAATGGYPAYYMINCAHPAHFAPALAAGGDWTTRIGGLRANASRLSHAELDEAPELDIGNPAELGREHRELVARLPQLAVLGGCCGTDHRHVEAIADACLRSAA
jgi:S-methylmethionine-dependent homocysteine/selenocysteine methylase